MARTLTTETNLSSYIGKYVKIEGSDCCWKVLGKAPKDLTLRPINVVDSAPTCDYISGMAQIVEKVFSEMELNFIENFP